MTQPFSLTSRLTVFFTLGAGAVLLGLSALILAALERHFIDLDRAALEDKIHLTQAIVNSAGSTDALRQRLGDAVANHHGLFVLVQDQLGARLYESAGFAPPASVLAKQNAAGNTALVKWQAGEQNYLALGTQGQFGAGDARRLSILVAMDTAHHDRFMTGLRRTLNLYMVIATMISGFLGWLAARQGLTPLRSMKAKAAAVTAHQLNQRMSVTAVPVEMAELAHALNLMLERLQDDFRRLSEFSSDLAHELRTPVSNLMTQTQVTLSQKRDPETYRDILSSNAEELQRLARMVSDMLFLAKTEHGIDLPSETLFAVRDEVLALFDFYEALAEEKQIAMHLVGAGDIVGDRPMVRRALSNLLSNALRYTPPSGELTVRIASSSANTTVTVENTGTAIPPDILPRLFERFYRADASRAHPESDGAGLGLSITKAIVEAHGGVASAASANGTTRFTLVFPHG